MRRIMTLAVLTFAFLAFERLPAQNPSQTVKDLDGAVQAMKSNSAVDRAAGLSYLFILGDPGKPYTRDVVGFLFDNSADVRVWAGMALGNVNPQLAGPVLTVAQGTDYNAKMKAMQQLAAMGNNGAAAVPAMLNFLQQAKPEDKAALIKDVTAAGKLDPTVSGVLAKLALNDPDPTARKAALAAIPQMQNKQGAIDVFANVLTTSTDPTQRANVITAVSAFAQGNPQAAQVLQTAMKDPSPTVRAAAQKAVDDLKKKEQPKK